MMHVGISEYYLPLKFSKSSRPLHVLSVLSGCSNISFSIKVENVPKKRKEEIFKIRLKFTCQNLI